MNTPFYTVEKIFYFARNQWNCLFACGALVLALTGGFLSAPPRIETEHWVDFGRFFVAAFVGLLFIAAVKWNKNAHARGWIWVTIVSIALAILCFGGYLALSAAWTTKYNGDRVIVGLPEHLPPDIRDKYFNVHWSMEEIVKGAAGNTRRLWSLDELLTRDYWLAGLYLVCLSLFTTVIVALPQAIFCRTRT